MPWPATIPDDLRSTLDPIIHGRYRHSADVWTELRSWLIKHGVEAPDLPPPGPQPWDGAAMRDQ